MTARTGLPVPTLGYASQTKAIEALYKDGVSIFDIICITGSSVNSAYRAIAAYKKRNGIRRQPLQKQIVKERIEAAIEIKGDPWEMDENKRRAMFHARAVKAAAALRKQAEKLDSHA